MCNRREARSRGFAYHHDIIRLQLKDITQIFPDHFMIIGYTLAKDLDMAYSWRVTASRWWK